MKKNEQRIQGIHSLLYSLDSHLNFLSYSFFKCLLSSLGLESRLPTTLPFCLECGVLGVCGDNKLTCLLKAFFLDRLVRSPLCKHSCLLTSSLY